MITSTASSGSCAQETNGNRKKDAKASAAITATLFISTFSYNN